MVNEFTLAFTIVVLFCAFGRRFFKYTPFFDKELYQNTKRGINITIK